jgi:hypothetical protein
MPDKPWLHIAAASRCFTARLRIGGINGRFDGFRNESYKKSMNPNFTANF